jgi:NSS family neurotransmitter:Na+ symporter
LIPYFVALFTAGIPLMMLEYGLGIKMQGSAPASFAKVGKRFEWVGWWAIMVSFFLVTYYAVIIAWCWNYLFYSSKLAWGDNTEAFFSGQVLQLSQDLGSLGGIPLNILIGLILTWVCIYLVIYRGARQIGKVVMWAVPLPLILLMILVIRGLTLPGAVEGISYYLTPNFKELLSPQVWLAAYGQVFFSLGVAAGVMIAYASYLPRDSDVTNNTFITSLADGGVSFFAGFAIFSILGYLAQVTGVGVGEVASSGIGLAFITIPTAVSKLPAAAAFFGVIFFLTLLSLAFTSAFSLVESCVSSLTDKWHISRSKATLVVSTLAFSVGLIYSSRGGLYWLDITDHWVCNYGLAVVGLFEAIVLAYFFGASPFRRFLNSVSEIKVGRWWEIMVKFVAPLILGLSLCFSLYQEFQAPYQGYPIWTIILGGWAIAIGAIIVAFLFQRMKGREN